MENKGIKITFLERGQNFVANLNTAYGQKNTNNFVTSEKINELLKKFAYGDPVGRMEIKVNKEEKKLEWSLYEPIVNLGTNARNIGLATLLERKFLLATRIKYPDFKIKHSTDIMNNRVKQLKKRGLLGREIKKGYSQKKGLKLIRKKIISNIRKSRKKII